MAHGSRHFDVLAPRSKLYKGPFGRLFSDLPPWETALTDAELLNITNTLMTERPGANPGVIAADNAEIDALEAEFGSNIPAAYTYFGQFVDHDITFDPASSLMRQNDPNGLQNFRTPRLDLDNVYGAGPDQQPYLYDQANPAKMAIGTVSDAPELPDLPRFGARALIGDPRNDENAIVSQLQLAFLLAHNTLVDRATAQHPQANPEELREMARKSLRWLYQHIVWNDFIPRIVVNEVHECALALEDACGGRKVWNCGLDDVYSWKHQPYMPIEFSVAAYRFGHSMVRNSYQTNAAHRGFGNHAPIFDLGAANAAGDLRGFRPMIADNCIQWDWFLPMGNGHPDFPQMARKIDTKLCNALAHLPFDTHLPNGNVLAFRNLKRGLSFGLPSGTSVAKHLCVTPLNLGAQEPDALWYYVLREGQRNGGNTMGRVGSIIVSATFAGLLKGDPNSWVNIEPEWTPSLDPLLQDGVDNVDDPGWTLTSIIRLSGIDPAGVGVP